MQDTEFQTGVCSHLCAFLVLSRWFFGVSGDFSTKHSAHSVLATVLFPVTSLAILALHLSSGFQQSLQAFPRASSVLGGIFWVL